MEEGHREEEGKHTHIKKKGAEELTVRRPRNTKNEKETPKDFR